MRLLTDPPFLSATIGRIYDCIQDPARWEPLLADLGALIGARRSVLGVITMRGGGQIQAMNGYAEVPLERVAQYTPINPGLPYGLVWPYDRAFVFSRDMGLDALKATRFFREYLTPLGDLDCISFLLTREGDAFGHWALITQDDRPPITEAEAEGFTLIAPHMRRAIEIARLLNVQLLEADTYRGALDQLDSAVLVLDRQRRLLHANPRAEAALDAGAVLRLREGLLAGATAEVEALLRRVTQDAASRGAAGLEATVTGTDGQERLLFAVALGTTAEEDRRAVMLVLRSPREDTRNPVAIAARVFGLTPAQVQVLAFLAQGHAPEAIADIIGVSVSTVRTHLSDLFRKTDTTRQAELVARALSFASPLRGDDTEL